MTKDYDIVIVGGGIVGVSIAYHLATETDRSVCLLERDQLTSGTTWHAAGLVAEVRATPNLTRLAKYTANLYDRLQDSSQYGGDGLGYRRCGALTLAMNNDRAFEIKKLAAMARAQDIDCHWLSTEAILERWPYLEGGGMVGGIYMPRDGMTNPVDTTQALARAAKSNGAVIKEHQPVNRLLADDGQILGVMSGDQEILASQVVVAAGLWTRALGQATGADFPLYPAEHFYAVSEPTQLPDDMPVLRYPDDGIYIKPDAGGRILVGCFERQAKPLDPETLPADFAFGELPFDMDHFLPYYQAATERVPDLENVGVRTWFNGPESFTPDGRYMLGESPQINGLYVAAGMNSIGIQSAGGIGKVMAHWLQHRRPPMDLWDVDVRRFLSFQNRSDYLVPRTAESLGRLYAMHWPYYQHESARGQRRSPFYEACRSKGACFGELAGWERPNWYGEPGSDPTYDYTYGRPAWFDQCAEECRAVRNDVALFDQTSFAKYEITGADACKFLNRLSTANVDVPAGQVVYCQWLNELGGIEADVTITRIDETHYWVISAAAVANRDLHWLAQHRSSYDVQIQNITEDYAVLGIMGPNTRDTLQAVCAEDLAHAAFPFGSSQMIRIAGQQLRATRITYVGALGWELYIPWRSAKAVYDKLSHVRHAGYHAMDSLRMEKAYRHWGHDITDEDTPLEAGLSFTIDWEKADTTIGIAQVAAQKQRGLDKRLVLFQLQDSQTLLTHDEPIWYRGERHGHVVSSAYSHTLKCTLAFGYLHGDIASVRAEIPNHSYQIEVADQRIAAKASLSSIYDPEHSEIHC